jgi:CRISPR-associated protein Cmr6
LENAGICFHPLYGFVYLPGSSLKGMARAYAETVWKPVQEKEEAARSRIEEVFGNQPGEPKPDAQRVGAIVFHDAWPEQWPPLIMDIVNNHHPDYYQAKPEDNAHAPGDWENPVPVYFLAVKPGPTFSFALSKRRANVPDDTLDLATTWLVGALCHLGAGAKTAAGYGAFQPVEGGLPPLHSTVRAVFEANLELVSPAFLAGASQEREDCDLRPASLRGLLRWWWRTMHAGFVNVSTLRRMEATIWGDTNVGGAVRITLPKQGDATAQIYNKQDTARAHSLPRPPNDKTTQGLWYHSYGMDEKRQGQSLRRSFLSPGSRWLVRLAARAAAFPPDADRRKAKKIDGRVLLNQAQAALWLFCHWGGIGSKSRKGFGSFADPAEMEGYDLQQCQQLAAAFRRECGIAESAFDPSRARSPALGQMLCFPEVPTYWNDPWFALDQLGASAQQFAQGYKHHAGKKALGLPRNVRPPVIGTFQPGQPVAKTGRHASPVFYHLTQDKEGKLVIRVSAFPACELPNLEESTQMLTALLEHLHRDLRPRIEEHKHKGPWRGHLRGARRRRRGGLGRAAA